MAAAQTPENGPPQQQGPVAPDEDEAPQPAPVREHYPTHRLRDIKAGVNGVQFLVSSKEHLYDVEQMEGGDGVWQAVGVWEDPTIQEGIRALRERQYSQELNRPGNAASDSRNGGVGRTLGGSRIVSHSELQK